MFKNKMSLRLRIFISMILLVFTATLLVLGSTYYQYRTESDQYNSYRQERKETQLKRQINYINMICQIDMIYGEGMKKTLRR